MLRQESNDLNYFLHPNRIDLMNILVNGETSFKELVNKTNLTQGNLASHLRQLEKHKAIKYRKAFQKRYPITYYSITEQGKINYKVFKRWIKAKLG